MSEKKEEPKLWWVIPAIIIIAVGVLYIAGEALIGIAAFLSEGGWRWLLVILSLAVFVALIMHARGD